MRQIDRYMTEREYDARVNFVQNDNVKKVLREHKKILKANGHSFPIRVGDKILFCKLI